MPQAPSTTLAPRVAAVVVNYDGRELTELAVASLRGMRYPAWDLVVLDNASRDGSPEALAALFPDLRQLRVKVNRGASAGYAAGMRWAFAQGYDYVLLLNNDIEVDPGMLEELVAVAESDPAIGAVGPKCYFHGEPQRLWSTGGWLGFRNSITRERGLGELDNGQYDRDEDVGYVTGCAILVKRVAAEAAGLWDPVYFICVDDADYCTRLRRAGFRCRYAHRAVLWHRVAWTTGGYEPGRNYRLGRSGAIYARRFARPWQWPGFLAWSVGAAAWAWLRELRRGNQAAATAKLRGLWAGLREGLPPSPPLDAALPLETTAAAWEPARAGTAGAAPGAPPATGGGQELRPDPPPGAPPGRVGRDRGDGHGALGAAGLGIRPRLRAGYAARP